MGVTRPADLLRAADTAQYAAKRGGRGRVCLADPRPAVDWRRPLQPAPPQRRRRRRGAAVDLPALLVEGVSALDGPLARAAVPHRLQDVVSRIAVHLNAARAAISVVPRGARTLDVVYMLDTRRARAWHAEIGASDEVWLLSEYPSTAAILTGGSFVVHADDDDADPAERAVLREFGLQAVLAAGADGPGGSWLAEVYADSETAPLEPVEAAVRLLVAEAVRGRRALAAAEAVA
jgi:hypothetical protein